MKIAIVGRPNVGKSSLLNRLAGRRVSIVDPTPGITRDRVSTIVEIDPPLETADRAAPILVEFTDTGGYGVYTAEDGRYDDIGADLAALTGDIERQIALAVERADLIVLVIDAQTGLTPLDERVATLLRRRGRVNDVILVANKVDGESWAGDAAEAASLGFGDPIPLSAENGFGVRALLDTVHARAKSCIESRFQTAADDGEAGDDDENIEFSFAIVGKRNAGKSTLLNALAGEPRAIVSEIAGTTRDAIDVRFEFEGHAMTAIDTAGVRKRKSMSEDVEYYAHRRVLAAIRRADVCMLLIDATEPVSQVDKKLAHELTRQFKPTVIVINKWDLLESSGRSPEDYLDYITQQLHGLDFAPIVCISAKEGAGLRELIAMAVNLYQQASHRESTSAVNDLIEQILSLRGPSSRLGTQAKVYYASQVATNPPTIVLMVNDPELFEGRYERYLLNRLREELPFSEVPIRLLFRERKRMSMSDLKSRPRAAASPDDGE